MTLEEQFVRNAWKKGVLFLSDHAYEKMRNLKIELAMVINCIEKGWLVETQAGYKDESPRMLFYNGHSNPFYVVAAIEVPSVVVITVCETDFTKWRICGDSIVRI